MSGTKAAFTSRASVANLTFANNKNEDAYRFRICFRAMFNVAIEITVIQLRNTSPLLTFLHQTVFADEAAFFSPKHYSDIIKNSMCKVT